MANDGSEPSWMHASLGKQSIHQLYRKSKWSDEWRVSSPSRVVEPSCPVIANVRPAPFTPTLSTPSHPFAPCPSAYGCYIKLTRHRARGALPDSSPHVHNNVHNTAVSLAPLHRYIVISYSIRK